MLHQNNMKDLLKLVLVCAFTLSISNSFGQKNDLKGEYFCKIESFKDTTQKSGLDIVVRKIAILNPIKRELNIKSFQRFTFEGLLYDGRRYSPTVVKIKGKYTVKGDSLFFQEKKYISINNKKRTKVKREYNFTLVIQANGDLKQSETISYVRKPHSDSNENNQKNN